MAFVAKVIGDGNGGTLSGRFAQVGSDYGPAPVLSDSAGVEVLGAVTASPAANTISDRLKTINTSLGSPFQAGASIGNTAFAITGAIPAGSNVIGHVIVDTAPTTAVTGTFWQTTQPVSLAALPALVTGAAVIGKVSLQTAAADVSTTNALPTIAAGLISNPAKAAITRLANTTAYAVGDILADNAAAGSITLFSWTGATLTGSGGTGVIDGLAISKTGANSLTARAHFFNATVTPANGDNGVFAISSFDLDKYIGYIDVLVSDLINNGGAVGVTQNAGLGYTLASGDTIYCLLETLNAYAPASAEAISLRPKIKRFS